MPKIPVSYLACATFVMFIVTYLLRGFAFIAFGGKKTPPDTIVYIGQVISPAIIAALIVYCLKNTSVLSSPYGLPELAATATCILLHLWKRNSLLSIIASTAVYMILVQNMT